jgi:hypothetical protein
MKAKIIHFGGASKSMPEYQKMVSRYQRAMRETNYKSLGELAIAVGRIGES